MTGTGRLRSRTVGAACALGLATLGTALVLAGGASAQGNCQNQPVTLPGGVGNDVITGTPGNDVIDAQGGDDTVNGGGGDDIICAGIGSDVVAGGQGNDQIEGGEGDDLLVGDLIDGGEEVGGGDDIAAGGNGFDVVVGDSIANGFAGGQGDDLLNLGDGNDVGVGDAYSTALAVGIGEDEVQGGPGTDIAIGDAMVGNPISSLGGPVPRQGAGELGAFGSGEDLERTQTGDDVLVGDAANFNPAGGGGAGEPGFTHPSNAYCGTKFTRQIISRRGAGWDGSRIRESAENELITEFQDDFEAGNCLSMHGLATGSGPDRLNSGTEDDAVVGGNVGIQAVVSKTDDDEGLSGKNDDWFWGDNYTLDLQETSPPSAVQFTGEPPAVEGASSLKRLSLTFFVTDGSKPFFQQTFMNDLELARSAPFDLDDIDRTGGGDDDLRGGKHNDALEGGPKRDGCHGGPGKNRFATQGPLKCETITGA